MKAITLLLCLIWASPAPALTLKVDPKRTLIINRVVDGTIMKEAARLEKLSRTPSPIFLIINSPGGEVMSGLQFITAMDIAKARGNRLVCVVPVLAASMAFSFFVNCNERYTFYNSLLLWHPMKLSSQHGLSQEDLEAEAREILELEAPLILKAMKAMNIDLETFKYHYRRETLWTARRLRALAPDFLTIVDDVQGTNDLFKFED